MSDVHRSIETEVEVIGTPEQVWQAIATGPGVSSWYVPHDIGSAPDSEFTASFGPGPEMQVAGRVSAWEPPHRVKFEGPVEGEGLAFEWTIEAKDGGTCVVRLVNSGFGEGDEWDDQYDAMVNGWAIFLANLQLHLEHFAPATAASSLPMAIWPMAADLAWVRLTDRLGVPRDAAPGDRITVAGDGAAPLSGTIMGAHTGYYSLLIDSPAPGTGFVSTEGQGDVTAVSIWTYLYGDEGHRAAERDQSIWQEWLDRIAPS